VWGISLIRKISDLHSEVNGADPLFSTKIKK
jgi:hypothetical protein